MKSEHWRKIEAIYHAALEREEDQRAAFLEKACASDEALRREVESLLAQEGETESFLEAPALEVAARGLEHQLSSYEILSLLGTGGMGEVYRAHDRKLGREVAIKVLPKEFSQDPERLARLEREARLLASLNHPHIGAIYTLEESDGVRFLVLELVPGETLAERLKAGPLEVPEALRVCAQIAEALEAAHERGVIHRDLKPANVKVTPEGQVKVLDFGLAKAQPSDGDLSQAGTVSAAGMETGVILGTVGYMSPDQARGKDVDKRTDVWAFGCVLYELLTGQRAFAGATMSDTIAAILEREPDWQALPQTTPAQIRNLLRRCFQKDARRRLRDMGDARIEIEEALNEPPKGLATAELAIGAAQPAPGRRAIPWMLGGLLAIMAAITVWSLWRASPPAQRPVSRLVINLPQGQTFWEINPVVEISLDGTQIAYLALKGDSRQLYVRRLNELKSRPIPGTAGAFHGRFSPDGKWLVFGGEDGVLKKVSLSGGALQTLCNYREIAGQGPLGLSWTPNGNALIFGGGYGLFRVSADGGTPEVVASAVKDVEHYHAWPQVLPGGKAVLFTVGQIGGESVGLLSLETGERRTLIARGGRARYVPTGHLVYGWEDKLLAAPFDLDQLQLTGPPAVVLEGLAIYTKEVGQTQFSVSESGSLVYIPGGLGQRTLVWVDRQGAVEPLAAPLRIYDDPHLSPDGQRLAVQIGPESGNSDIWIYHIPRGTLARLTFERGNMPRWMPDGKRLAFGSRRAGGPANLFWKPADGSGPAEQLTESERVHLPSSWSPDGQVLAFEESHPTTGMDIWVLPLQGERKPRPFLQTQFGERAPVFSPDGHWLAYMSNESGRNEVYVQPYPGPGGKWQISTEGGNEPLWAKNGRELFYRNGNKMMAVEVTTQPTFRAGTPTLLFEGQYHNDFNWSPPNYDVTPDGQRFLMIQPGEKEEATQINVVLNWFEELKRLVPTEQN